MNYKEIDILKGVFSNMLKNQYTLRSIELGINGKLIAVGYNPYWTSRLDSKIEKIELSFLNSRGIMVPLVLKNVVDFEIYPKEGRRSKKYRINSIELMTLSPYVNPKNQKDIYDRVKFEVIYDD